MSKELNLPERVAKFQTDVLQTFLLEYCKINHVEECELSGHLSVLRLENGTIQVDRKDCDADERLLLKVSRCPIAGKLRVQGSVLELDYPETRDCIKTLSESLSLDVTL
jgi:hypothetical protein